MSRPMHPCCAWPIGWASIGLQRAKRLPHHNPHHSVEGLAQVHKTTVELHSAMQIGACFAEVAWFSNPACQKL